MGASSYDNFSYAYNTGSATGQKSAQTGESFSRQEVVTGADGSKENNFHTGTKRQQRRSIVHEYTIKKDDYLVDLNVKMTEQISCSKRGDESYLAICSCTAGIRYIVWKTKHTGRIWKTEVLIIIPSPRKSHKEFDEKVNWIGIRQRFFCGIMVAKMIFPAPWNGPFPRIQLRPLFALLPIWK